MKAKYATTQQVHFDIPSSPYVMATEVWVPSSLTFLSTLDNKGIVKSPQQWKGPCQWYSPPCHSNASYKGSPSWRNNSCLKSSPLGADSSNWRGNGSASPRGSSSPNWRHKHNSLSKQNGTLGKNFVDEFNAVGKELKTLRPTIDSGFSSVSSDIDLGFQTMQKNIALAVGSQG